MILGNSLNGMALCLDRFIDHLASRSSELELYVAYGATRRETLEIPLRTAVRTGMIPIINAMSVVGIVALPGMMTGQILAGSPPMQAVAYQIVVMFMIAAATSFGAMAAAIAAGRRLVSPDGTLRLERLRKD
jgi:putative ABC transport system permease protein